MSPSSGWSCLGFPNSLAASWWWTQGSCSDLTRRTLSTSWTYGATRSWLFHSVRNSQIRQPQLQPRLRRSNLASFEYQKKISSRDRCNFATKSMSLQNPQKSIDWLFVVFYFGDWRYAEYLDIGTILHQDQDKNFMDITDDFRGSLLLYTITIPMSIITICFILTFIFVTGGDGLLFKICHDDKTRRKELKKRFINPKHNFEE